MDAPDVEVPPEMPPMPKVLEQKQMQPQVMTGCPPCQMPMPMMPMGMGMGMMPYYKEKSRKKGGGNSTFFLMLISAAFFSVGIWFSIRLPSYAPGGTREDAKTFTFVQILSTSLISAGVLVLVIAWFTGK